MKSLLLFPVRFRLIGVWIMFLSMLFGMFCLFSNFEFSFLNLPMFAIYGDQLFGKDVLFSIFTDNLTLELFGILYVVGLLFAGFSRLPEEDEFSLQIRYNALMWSALISCILLIFTILFFYGSGFFICMIFNMFWVPTLYVLRFHYLVYRFKTQGE